MNMQSFRNRNGLIILVCIIMIVLIYSVDILKLGYRMTSWREFGKTPVPVSQIQYLIADTPNVTGYEEPGGSKVSCATTVAYLRTDADETYRCCDTGEKISCLPGDFSSDIPIVDEVCITSLREAFGIPTHWKVQGITNSTEAVRMTVFLNSR